MSISPTTTVLKNNRKLLKKPHLPYMGQKPVGGVARKNQKGSFNKVSKARLKRIHLHKKRQRQLEGLRTILVTLIIMTILVTFFWIILA